MEPGPVHRNGQVHRNGAVRDSGNPVVRAVGAAPAGGDTGPGADPAVRWLDEGEQRIWRTFMLAMRLLFDHFDRELQRTSGMPMTYYEVLVRLSEAPGRSMRMSELADRAQNSRSRLSHAVARLEAAGWVRREQCPSDRRGAVAVLTTEGLVALEAAAPAHVESVRAGLFDPLSAGQVDALGRISAALLEHLAHQGVICPDALPTCLQVPGAATEDGPAA